jgi:hypothetical protein
VAKIKPEPQPDAFTTDDRRLLIELANRVGLFDGRIDRPVANSNLDGGSLGASQPSPAGPPFGISHETLVIRLNESTRLVDFLSNSLATVFGPPFEHTKDSPELGCGYPITDSIHSINRQLIANNERLLHLASALSGQFNFPPPDGMPSGTRPR